MNAEINVENTILKTERLLLRPWKQEDLNDLYAYASVDGVGQMAGWLPHQSIEESQTILDKFINEKKTFAIVKDNHVIGSLGIEKYNEEQFPEFEHERCREIGYVLSKDYWGQGLMPEAVKEVIRWLFEDIGLDVIFCGHFLRNAQSARVQEKCGFHPYAYGIFRTYYGTAEGNVMNILYREEYMQACNIKKRAIS